MTIQDTTLDVVGFVRRFHGLAREEFLSANPHPFLLGDPHGLVGQEAAFRTCTLSEPIEVDDVVDRPTDKNPKPGRALVPEQIYPIVKRPGTPFPHMISVGRSANNDIVLAFPAVSKLHAFFSHVPETGEWTLVDAESSNGTFLDDRRLVAHERYAVADGTRLVFGDIGLGWISSETMFESLGEIARRLARAGLL